MSTILFYSDTNCQTQVPGGNVTGPSDGFCTQFGISNIGSFAVRSLGQACVVTVYQNDEAYCSSKNLQVVSLGQCISNSTISQFSVDGCRDTNAAAPPVVSITTSSAASATTMTGASGAVSLVTVTATAAATASSSSPAESIASGGLSAGVKAGVGVGIALAVTAVIAIVVFFVLRYAKKKRTPPVRSEEKNLESDSGVGIAPAYSFRDNEKNSAVLRHHELSPEERPLAELPQGRDTSGLVEAPGDHSWTAHEIGVGSERSELSGSTPNLHAKERRMSK